VGALIDEVALPQNGMRLANDLAETVVIRNVVRSLLMRRIARWIWSSVALSIAMVLRRGSG